MHPSNSQETCSTTLKKCPLDKLAGFVGYLEPIIGKAGGRRFIEHPRGEQNIALKGTISINDVVKRLDTLWKDLSKSTNALDRTSIEAVLNTVSKIREKDREASVKLKEKNILIRMFTAVRSFFGNIGFNCKVTLESIEKAAKRGLEKPGLVSVSASSETKSTKKEASQTILEPDAKIEALIFALSHLTSANYAQTKQALESSPNDIVCTAIRRSINNGKYGVFLATMSGDKFESVLRTAAQEAQDSSDYQLFALLVSRSLMLCPREKIIESVKIATNGNGKQSEMLLSKLDEYLNDSSLFNAYRSIVYAAQS